MKITFDYSYLLGFIKSNKEELGNNERFAKFLGISYQALSAKLNGKSEFSQSQIGKMKQHFHLSDSQLNLFFFYVKELKK